METTFTNLNHTYFYISELFAERQLASGRTEFVMQNPRPTDAFLLFSGTTGICYQKGKAPLFIPQGALVYLPKNCCYVWENSPAYPDNVQENLLFEFTLSPAKLTYGEKGQISRAIASNERISLGTDVSILSTQHSALYRKLFLELIDAFEHRETLPLAVYNTAYEIFQTVSHNCSLSEHNQLDTDIIKAGIHYLEEYPLQKISIAEIAKMCGVSISYFERIFKSYAGIPPIEFKNNHKIYHIKQLLQEDELNLETIAEQMGYCDSGYLCRFFKKMTGMTPKEYKKLYNRALS